MDIDLDFSDDRIRTFLENKLQELKTGNEKLQLTLMQRQHVLQNTTEHVENQTDVDNLKLSSPVLKKMFNDKYALITKIENCSGGQLDDVKLLLNWDSLSPISYDVNIYEENEDVTNENHKSSDCTKITNSIKPSQTVRSLAYVVIVLDVPDFTDKLIYSINGNIICWKNNREISLSFPTVDILSGDRSNHQLLDWHISKGDLQNLLTFVSCTEKTELLMVLPETWNVSLESTFEIHCSLTTVNIGKVHCKKYYVASKSFEESMIEVHSSEDNLYFVTVYTRNNDALLSLLHHLHSSIPNVLFIPKGYYENYLLQNSKFSKTNLVELNENLKKELNFVYTFLQENSTDAKINASKLQNFRNKLCDIERKSDSLYLKACNVIE